MCPLPMLPAVQGALHTSLASSSLWIAVVRSFQSGTTLRICSNVIMTGEGPVRGMRLASSAVSCLDGRNLAMTGMSLACGGDSSHKDEVSWGHTSRGQTGFNSWVATVRSELLHPEFVVVGHA